MPTVVKLLVLGPNDERIGSLVLDLDSLFQMWRNAMHERLAAQAETYHDDGQQGGERSVPISEHLEWVEDDEGQISLRPRRKPPEREADET